MNIVKLHFKPEETCNTYIIGNPNEGCIIVDPGSNLNDCLDNYIDRHHSSLDGILITHGHYDHISGLKNLKCKAKVYIGSKEILFLTDPSLNLTAYSSEEELILDNIETIALNDNERFSINGLTIQVIETPFHTVGSVCYYFKELNALFSGDTLFHLGIGRYDLPGAPKRELMPSLKKLTALPKETKVYPGHGENTSLENEFAYNDYLKGFFK